MEETKLVASTDTYEILIDDAKKYYIYVKINDKKFLVNTASEEKEVNTALYTIHNERMQKEAEEFHEVLTQFRNYIDKENKDE